MLNLRWNVRQWRSRLICCSLVFLTLSLVVLSHYQAPVQAQLRSPAFANHRELRGVWLTNVDSDVLFDRDRLRTALEDLASLNFNTIYPTVWNEGYTLYPSAVAERVMGQTLDPTPGLQGRDMLAEAVETGHRHHLSVIPWLEFGLMAPADSQLVARHPDWITQRRNRNPIVMQGAYRRVWLNPLHPEVQRLMLELVAELVTNYDVDGIQLDDHFGMPVELGYDPLTVQQYRAEHGGRLPPANPRNPEWMRWRANKLTDLMVQVFYTVKDHCPDCIVSLSPNPQQFSYDYYLQDWFNWERRGLVEELIVQLYRSQVNAFINELNQPPIQAARQHIPTAIGILSGLKNRSVPSSRIREQVQLARSRGFAGVSFFFYETLWTAENETVAQRRSMLRSLFPTAMPRPTLIEAKT